MGTSGSEGGQQKPTNREAGRALLSDPYTYVSTCSGWVYVAFVIDAYARRILGWRAGTSMATQLVLDAVDQAIWTRGQAGHGDLAGLVQHHDHGSQYVSLAYSERLAAASIRPSVGAVGSSYDNALAETINGLYKTELIKKRGPWRSVDHVEIATADGSTGSTTAASTSIAATCHQPRWKPLTKLRPEPSSTLSSQTDESPDMPGRFNPWRRRVVWAGTVYLSGRPC